MNTLPANNTLTDTMFSRFVQYLDTSPRTVETYARALKQFQDWLRPQSISSPTRADILRYRDGLRETHSPATTQLYMAAIRQFFRWAAQEGLYQDISANIKGAKISRKHKKDALTPHQIQSVLSNLQGKGLAEKRDYALISLAVTGGLRTIELVRADIADLRNLGESTVLYIQGKGQSEKTDYIRLPTPVLKAVNAGYRSDRLTAHSLRHTAATLNLALGGGTLEETQQLLRHSDINTTMIYLHHLERENNHSEERIADAIF